MVLMLNKRKCLNKEYIKGKGKYINFFCETFYRIGKIKVQILFLLEGVYFFGISVSVVLSLQFFVTVSFAKLNNIAKM